MMKKPLARLVLILGASVLAGGISYSADQSLTQEEKIIGFMTVYAEVKYNFVFADRLKDWDEQAARLLPEILAAPDVGAYYNLLKRWVGRLGNGHTLVHAPNAYWDFFNMPPVEVRVIGGRVYVARVGRRDDLVRQFVRPGLEILEVDGESALVRFEREILPLCSYSRKETACARYSMWCLAGPKNVPVRLKVADGPRGPWDVILRRDPKQDDGEYFIRLQEDPFRHNLETRRFSDILYINLTTFAVESASFLPQFDQILRQNDAGALKGIILDLRANGGGNDEAAFGAAGRFLSKPAPGAKSRVRKYSGARKAWGMADEWEEIAPAPITPASDETIRYAGPLALLVGAETASAAEDFAMVLQSAGRAVLVGERTAGDTGQIITFSLPRGGLLWVCTKWDFQPDGRDLIGIGLRPDHEVPQVLDDLPGGTDRALEKAIDVIRRSMYPF